MKVLIVFALALSTGVSAKIRGRILLGEDADPLDFKYQVRIIVPDLEDGTLYIPCGGSVIHNRWVLTAAHCFEDGDKNRSSVLLGLTNENVYSVHKNATDVIIHGGYNYVEYELINDIALMKIESVEFNQYIQPVLLSNMSSLDNQVIIAAGWGLINSTTYPTRMQYSILNVLNSTECERVFQAMPATQFCTRSFFQVACAGDSGSPVVTGYGGNAKQVGLISHGSVDCSPNATTVYTRTYSYLTWIRTQTRINRL